MMSEELLKRFCSNRNIKCSTLKSYRSAIAKYEFFHDMAMGSLMDEAIVEEDEGISLKSRKIKSRLLDFRHSYWIQGWQSALSEPIFPESRHSIGILKLNCPI